MIDRTIIANYARKIELDQAVFFSILSRIWALIAGPVSALLIAFFFSADVQGYYYTFGTILALQVFIELGLGSVTQQFSSHEWSKLSLNSQNEIVGDEKSLSRLISITRISLKWFGIGGVIATVVLIIGGYLFFHNSPGDKVDWKLPWTCLCLVTGISLILTPVWSILEGCNQVKQLYRYRFFQGTIVNIAAWVSITLGALLWTGFIVSIVGLICAIIFLKRKYLFFFKTILFKKSKGPKISWKKDMLPMQWRIAISWISGYLSFSLFVPILFKYQGPAIAGQFGMTWSIVGIMAGIAGSWLNPKVPKFAILVAQKKYYELDHLLWKLVRIIFVILFFSSLFIWIFIFLINNINYSPAQHFAARLISPLSVAILLLAQIIMNISSPFSAYMRAHKQEPGMHLSVALGIMITLSTLILGKYFSVIGVSIGYLCSTIIIIPLLFLVWYQKHRIWTTDSFQSISH